MTLTLLALSAFAALQSDGGALAAARAHRTEHGAEILSSYAELLRVPNVAADPAGLRRNAELLRDRFARRGAEMELLDLPGAPPAVFGTLKAPGVERTLGIYVHYDGQPVDAASWTRPPFEPTLFTAAIEAGGEPRELPRPGEAIDPEWRLYARSAGDDKAPFAALLAALDALAGAGIDRTANLVFLFDGEEESGSPHLREFLSEHEDELGADLWLICDGPVHQTRKPQLVFGVRGITGLDVTVHGAAVNLHSGHYGNWAPNAGMMLSQLLASMKSADGEVLVAGFYDSVLPIGAAEREALAAIPDFDAALRDELGIPWTEGSGARLNDRLLLPSLNVRGLSGGGVGAAARNVIPRSATASLDVRLVKGNVPGAMLDLVEAHIRKQGYHIVRAEPDEMTRRQHARIAEVHRRGGYVAARTALDHPLVAPLRAAAERAFDSATEESVVMMPSLGGSLPLYLFEEILAVPFVIVPIANHDDNQHAPDENLRLANLWYGVDLFAGILSMP